MTTEEYGGDCPAASVDLADPGVRATVVELFDRRRPQLAAFGLDTDDVLQAVYLSILTRQRHGTPYDPARAPLRYWLGRVVSGVVNAEIDKALRYERRNGVVGYGEDVALREGSSQTSGQPDERDCGGRTSRAPRRGE